MTWELDYRLHRYIGVYPHNVFPANDAYMDDKYYHDLENKFGSALVKQRLKEVLSHHGLPPILN